MHIVAVPEERNSNNTPPNDTFEARSWYLVGEHPHTAAIQEATNGNGVGISCTKYFEARANLFLGLQQDQPRPTKPEASTVKRDPATKLAEPPRESSDQLQSGKVHDITNTEHHGAGAGRAKIFAEWLVHNLPILQHRREHDNNNNDHDNIACVPTLLDVAGGKGQLSVELAHLGALCTVVDPLVRSKRSLRKLEKSRKRLSPLQQQKEHDLPSFVAAYFEENQVMDDMVAKSNGLIGFHPDQCTETIVDMALKHNKPFAVVPCCVFPSLFPMRSLNSGKVVISYDDLLAYLLEKDDRMQPAELAMEGKNQVIFLAHV